jgi:DNA polymerase
MAEGGNSQLSAEIAAAFAWWREAGVDSAFRDEPANWIAPPAAPLPASEAPVSRQPAGPQKVAAAVPPPAPAFDPATLPTDLAAFTQWWLAEPWLDDGRVTERMAPRGEQGADVMIVVPEPEREDSDNLLSGAQGRLLDAMLTAFGLTSEQVYLATALPRHTPMADWAAAGQRGLGEVLRHHVALVAPRRLIAFGGNVLPLLGNDPPNSGHFLLEFNHGELSIPLWAATDLGVLLARPRVKARVWQQWLDWTGTQNT